MLRQGCDGARMLLVFPFSLSSMRVILGEIFLNAYLRFQDTQVLH